MTGLSVKTGFSDRVVIGVNANTKSNTQSTSGSHDDMDTSTALISTLSDLLAVFKVINFAAIWVVRNCCPLDSELRQKAEEYLACSPTANGSEN